jgi:hypothetical protein
LKVISKEDIRKQWATLPRYETVIIDECFTKGTKVLTDLGYKNIEDIKIGDTVANAIGWGKVENTIINTTDKIYKLTLSNGEIINVTGNHPFFTDKGWVKASDLNNSYLLMSYDVLQWEYEKQEKNSTFLRNLRKADSTWMASWWSVGSFQKDLFNRMCEKTRLEIHPMYLVKPSGETEIINSEKVFRENDKKESYVDTRSKGTSYGYSKEEWLQTYIPQKRKWSRNATTTKDIISRIGKWLGCRIPRSDKDVSKVWNISIEVDGVAHNNPSMRKKDIKKEMFLKSLGWKTLRFKNSQILKSITSVLADIQVILQKEF